jgi:cell division septum initiation protein DivIVA
VPDDLTNDFEGAVVSYDEQLVLAMQMLQDEVRSLQDEVRNQSESRDALLKEISEKLSSIDSTVAFAAENENHSARERERESTKMQWSRSKE